MEEHGKQITMDNMFTTKATMNRDHICMQTYLFWSGAGLPIRHCCNQVLACYYVTSEAPTGLNRCEQLGPTITSYYKTLKLIAPLCRW